MLTFNHVCGHNTEFGEHLYSRLWMLYEAFISYIGRLNEFPAGSMTYSETEWGFPGGSCALCGLSCERDRAAGKRWAGDGLDARPPEGTWCLNTVSLGCRLMSCVQSPTERRVLMHSCALVYLNVLKGQVL